MSTDSPCFRLKFWGVRGSLPTPQQQNLKYGGNTPCVEVRLPNDEIFIFDGGSGIRNLGQALLGDFSEQGLRIHLFFTHFHWDHLQGIPFFAPLFHPDADLIFHAHGDLNEKLARQMEPPYFPIPFPETPARKTFVEVHEDSLHFGDLRVRPFPLHHPQGCVGYRLEYKNTVVVYATDFEHGDSRHDRIVRDFSTGADALIFDAQYTPEEYEKCRGWGHSTWLEATRVAQDSQVRQLILFHHDPAHDDETMDRIVEMSQERFQASTAAREGSVVRV